ARKEHIIEFIVDVSLPASAKKASTPSPQKRKHVTDIYGRDEQVVSKRKQTYLTTIEEEETFYYALRSDCEITGTVVRWKSQPETVLVSVMEDNIVASGTTKNVFKGFIEQQSYAIKQFFNTGGARGATLVEESKVHARQELVRQEKARICLSEFNALLKDEKIPAA
ncbi:hypothetical protein H0H92_014711, partial [Tricholoma furcatifolium]